jgi:hypothetical protein
LPTELRGEGVLSEPVIHRRLQRQFNYYPSSRVRVHLSNKLILYSASPFNLSENLNLGDAAAHGDYVCLLNDDVEAITPRGGEELIGYLAANPRVGAIGPMCLREDKTIQQNGVALLANGPAHPGDSQPQRFGGHQAMLRCDMKQQ